MRNTVLTLPPGAPGYVMAQSPTQKSNCRDFSLAEHAGESAPSANGADSHNNPAVTASSTVFFNAPDSREPALRATCFMAIPFVYAIVGSFRPTRRGLREATGYASLRLYQLWRKIAVTA